MIPTAEEFLLNAFDRESGMQMSTLTAKAYKHVLINFAKLHVQEALQKASENAVAFEKEIRLGYMSYRKDIVVNKESIINAYPLENIK